MRYHLTTLMLLMLLIVLPIMHLPGAPVPAPSAVLDIGPPAKGETPEEHRSREIDYLDHPDNSMSRHLWHEPEVRKLPSVAALKPPRELIWFSDNLRVAPEGKGNRLRLTFHAGSRAEQVAVLNSVLRIYIRKQTDSRNGIEKKLQLVKEALPRLKKLAATEAGAVQRARYQKDVESTPSIIAELRTEIARYKEISVIKWAK